MKTLDSQTPQRASSPFGVRIGAIIIILMVAALMPMGATASDIATLYTKFSNSSGNEHKQVALELQRKLLEEEYLEKEFFEDEKYKGQSEAAILMGVSVYFFYEDQYTKSEEAGLKALALLHGVENVLTSDTYSTLGCSAQRKGNLPDALDYIQKGLAIDTKLGDRERMGSDLNTITGIYLAMEDAKSAEKYILRAIQLQRAVDAGKPSARLGIELGMASEVYLKLKKYEQALKYAKEAYDTAVKMGDKIVAAVRQCQIAAVLFDLQRYDEAEKTLREALPVLTDSKKNNSLAICYAQLADIMAVKNNDAKAEKYYRSALAICKTIGNRYLERRCEKGLAAALRTTNPVEAFKHLERYSVLADSIFSEESARQSNIFNAKYKNEELEMKNAEIEATNRAFRIILVATIVGLFLLITLAIALYVAFKHKSRAHEMAQRLEHARTSFFTNITHEFRTPLTVILGASERLKKGDLAPDEKPEKLYGMILRQGQGLLRLINQLLDISKVKSEIGNPDWRHGDVVPYLKMIANNYEDAANEKNIKFQFKTEKDEIVMDFVPDYVHKILNNLISNAIKFTPVEGSVSLTVGADSQNLVIRVADTGRGIPKAELSSIFEAFHQASNAYDKMGSGVGLALVKQVVTSMKGDVSINSTVGVGSTFTVQLPLRQILTTPAKALSFGELKNASVIELDDEHYGEKNENVVHSEDLPTVLVVEDNKDISYYIGSQLQSHYNVYYATNGEEGFALAAEIMPHLIITDLMMPVCDGFEFCQRLHESEALNHIPVVILTAKSDDADRIKALQVGVDNFMSKPFNSKELELRVQHLITQHEALREKFSRALAEGKEKEVDIAVPDRHFLEKLDAIISEKMQQGDIDIESIASALCMSQKQLRGKVSSITGETPSSYIQHLRLNKACTLLNTTDSQIGEIAMQCGFDDSAYFSRLFKQVYGITPTQFRKHPIS